MFGDAIEVVLFLIIVGFVFVCQFLVVVGIIQKIITALYFLFSSFTDKPSETQPMSDDDDFFHPSLEPSAHEWKNFVSCDRREDRTVDAHHSFH